MVTKKEDKERMGTPNLILSCCFKIAPPNEWLPQKKSLKAEKIVNFEIKGHKIFNLNLKDPQPPISSFIGLTYLHVLICLCRVS